MGTIQIALKNVGFWQVITKVLDLAGLVFGQNLSQI